MCLYYSIIVIITLVHQELASVYNAAFKVIFCCFMILKK